jgi:hypothetical protein
LAAASGVVSLAGVVPVLLVLGDQLLHGAGGAFAGAAALDLLARVALLGTAGFVPVLFL